MAMKLEGFLPDGHRLAVLSFEERRLLDAAPDLLKAAADLLADVRRRYPGEELKCPYMRALDAAARATT